MLFNSIEFIFLFLPLVWFVFTKLREQNQTASLTWLLAASLFFYGWWKPVYLILLLASMSFNYLVGSRLRKGPSKKILVVGIAFNLLLLAYYKYAAFILENLLFLVGEEPTELGIILPLAISFFTFQQIAFLVDAYEGETKAYGPLHYCLFVCFFPQLIAGPIVHHREMLPQFFSKKREPLERDLVIGATIFALGLFKKVCIADRMAPAANLVFSAADGGQSLGVVEAWVGALSYSLQLYFDFSGYSDMAIGAGRLFGIRLPMNFNSPYKAANIIDFWRRWHITLSRFLRDYLYIPLGGNRRGDLRKWANMFVTMVLGGLWHGAGWNFVIWGALHGAFLIANHAWQRLRGPTLNPALSVLVTFTCVVFAWVFFRAETFVGAKGLILSMLGFNGVGSLAMFQSSLVVPYIAVFLGACWLVPNVREITENKESVSWHWKPTVAWARAMGLVTAAALVTIVYKQNSVSEFLYFNF